MKHCEHVEFGAVQTCANTITNKMNESKKIRTAKRVYTCIGFDAGENEPSKVRYKGHTVHLSYLAWPRYTRPRYEDGKGHRDGRDDGPRFCPVRLVFLRKSVLEASPR